MRLRKNLLSIDYTTNALICQYVLIKKADPFLYASGEYGGDLFVFSRKNYYALHIIFLTRTQKSDIIN